MQGSSTIPTRAPLADNWKTDLNSMCPPQFIHFHSGRSYLEGNSGLHFPRVTLAGCQAWMGEVWHFFHGNNDAAGWSVCFLELEVVPHAHAELLCCTFRKAAFE